MQIVRSVCMANARKNQGATRTIIPVKNIASRTCTGYKAHLASPVDVGAPVTTRATLFYKLSRFTRELIGLKQRALIGIGVRVTIAMHSNKLSAIGKATTRTRVSRLPGTWCRTKSNLTRNETGLTIKCARVSTLRAINFSLSLLHAGTV